MYTWHNIVIYVVFTELDKSATTSNSVFIVCIVLSMVICVSLFILIKLWLKARKQGNNVVVEVRFSKF